jgi:signal peptidase II
MRRYLIHSILFGIAAVVILADQITKYLIRTNLAPYEPMSPIPALGDFLTFINTFNTGAAFGMLKAFGGVFTIIAVVVVGAIVYYYPRLPADQIGIRVALGLQLGGAIGNLIDRLFADGKVTDWIFFHFYNTLNAPVFNLADLSITCGVIVLALLMLRESVEERKAKAAAPIAPAPTNE